MKPTLEEILDAPGRLEEQLSAARLDTQAIWARCFRLVSRYDGMAGGRGYADARDGQSAALADARAEEERLEALLRQARNELERLVGRVRQTWGMGEAMVLRCRYLHGMTWKQTGDMLGCDESTARRKHQKALRLLKLPGDGVET